MNHRNAKHIAAALVATLAVACLKGNSPTATDASDARLSIHAQVAASAGSALRITIGYLDRGPREIPLDTTTVATQTGTATVPIVVDLSQCLGDPNRAVTGDGCALIIGIALVQNGVMVDSVTVPTVTAVPGQILNISPAVTVSPVGSVTITPDTSTVTVGDSAHLTVSIYDVNGKPLAGHSFTLTSANDTIARIDTSGYIVGIDGGATPIVAKAGDHVDTGLVNVTFAGGLALSATSVAFNSPTPTSPIPPHTYVAVTSAYPVQIGGLTAAVTYPAGPQTGWLAASVSDSTFQAPSIIARLRAMLANATTVTTPATLDVVPTRVLPAGTYTASVVVTGPDGAASPAIPVTYVVANGAQIGLSTTAFTDTVAVGSTTPLTTQVHITNSGIATLSNLGDSVTYGSGASGFVATSFAPSTTAPDSLAITLNPSALAVGTYTATIKIYSALPDVAPQTVAITLYVGPDPAVAFNQDTLTFTQLAAQQFNVSPQQFDAVVNAGVGTLGTIAQGAVTYLAPASGWLSVSLSGSTITAVPTSSLTPLGTLAATVPYTATNAVNNPQNLTVLLETQAQFEQVAVGGNFACGMLYGGTVYCWGDNTYGQLGQGTTGGSSPVGVYVPVPTPPAGGEIVSIAAGWYHACALSNSGPAYCWGRNDRGQAGTGVTSTAVTTPTIVAGGLSFNEISGGALFTCGLSFNAGNGTNVTCWGDNTYAQLGTGAADGNPHPTPYVGESFEGVATGATYVCANTLATGGQIYCWGDNSSGQLGIGTVGGTVPGFTLIANLPNITVLTAGDRTTCGLDTSNNAWCWGDNSSGELGTGSALARDSVPAEITGTQFLSLSAGNKLVCGTGSSGGVYCWGDNSVGALGIGSVGGTVGTPRLVTGTAGYTGLLSLSANGDTVQTNAMCFLTAYPPGVVYCAGSDSNGQLGVYPTIASTGIPLLPNGQIPETSGGSRVKHAPPKATKRVTVHRTP